MYEGTMLAATGAALAGGLAGNRWLLPRLNRKRIGRAAVWTVAVTWWIAPVYAVASYATPEICDKATLRDNQIPLRQRLRAETVAARLFDPERKRQMASADLPEILPEGELLKIQRAVMRDGPDYAHTKDGAIRARIWNRVARSMGYGQEYMRDEADIVAEDGEE
jgi:hypothetical protein